MQMKSFLWGAATSAHQVEGDNFHNDWWKWEKGGHTRNSARSGKATDYWNRFKTDLQLAQDLGLNSYRFSIEWSRIEPEPGKINIEAIVRYQEMISECENRALLPMLTLHHFTSPQWFSDQGGFSHPESISAFQRYVKTVVKHLGSRIPLWNTFNEPVVLVIGQYLGKFMPPGEFSPRKAAQALAHIFQMHAWAYQYLHDTLAENRIGLWKSEPLKVGFAHNILLFQPERLWHPIETFLTRRIDRFYNQAWLDAVTGKDQHFGVPLFIPKPKKAHDLIGKIHTDFIGVNYYTQLFLRWKPPQDSSYESVSEAPLGVRFFKKDEPLSDLKWSIYAEGLYKTLTRVAKYKLPIYITENGLADRQDQKRSKFIIDHLTQIARARDEDIPIEGYFHWSLLDNFEWQEGYWPRFGLYEVDYQTFERIKRPSAGIYQKIISAHDDGKLAPSLAILKSLEV
jgi:beta-glucosidase